MKMSAIKKLKLVSKGNIINPDGDPNMPAIVVDTYIDDSLGFAYQLDDINKMFRKTISSKGDIGDWPTVLVKCESEQNT